MRPWRTGRLHENVELISPTAFDVFDKYVNLKPRNKKKNVQSISDVPGKFATRDIIAVFSCGALNIFSSQIASGLKKTLNLILGRLTLRAS